MPLSADFSMTLDIAIVAQDCRSKGEAPNTSGFATGHFQQKQHSRGYTKGKVESALGWLAGLRNPFLRAGFVWHT